MGNNGDPNNEERTMEFLATAFSKAHRFPYSAKAFDCLYILVADKEVLEDSESVEVCNILVFGIRQRSKGGC